MREMQTIAAMESPHKSKNLSSMPILSTPRSSAQSFSISFSIRAYCEICFTGPSDIITPSMGKWASLQSPRPGRCSDRLEATGIAPAARTYPAPLPQTVPPGRAGGMADCEALHGELCADVSSVHENDFYVDESS